MSQFQTKVERACKQVIREIQSPLLDQASQSQKKNEAIAQVIGDDYVAGGGATSVSAASSTGYGVSSPLVGGRLLRPGDAAVNVGGRLF